MRLLVLSKGGINKVRSHMSELKAQDIDGSIKSIPPGEWCIFQGGPNELWVGYINSQIEDRFNCAYLLGKISSDKVSSFDASEFIQEKLSKAYARRKLFSGYKEGSRIFYGMSDGLPGLIVDNFVNGNIIQINTAGIDKYRDVIAKSLSEMTEVKSYFLDNPKYREKEFLPTFQTEAFPNLEVKENGLNYKIRSEVLQKVGFYYDHRENRLQLIQLLKRLDKKLQKGLDLFSYAGAWGMSALSAGVQQVDFVDQGDFTVEVEEALKLNGFPTQGKFHRQDVFKFLDDSISNKRTYDLILCDPPAFAKSALQKDQALDGYSKLHRKVFKALAPNSFVAFSSCTHYVGHDDFQKNVMDAARKENRNVQLIYAGMQGFDHPVKSLEDKANYIKSYFYIVE